MARGDGKALRGHTRAVKSQNQKPRFSKSGERKMAIGGNPGDLATGGFGTGISGRAATPGDVARAVDRGNAMAGGRQGEGGAGRGNAAPRMMSSAQDYASIVPGTVSLTKTKQFQPFAQTPKGLSLLAASKAPMTYAEAQKLMAQLPPKTEYSWNPVAPGSGFTSYPVKVNVPILGQKSGFVNIPNTAGRTIPGATIGSWNPAAPQAPAPVAASPAAKEITERLPQEANVVQETRKQFYDRISPTPAPKPFAGRMEGLSFASAPQAAQPSKPASSAPAIVTAGRAPAPLSAGRQSAGFEPREGGGNRPPWWNLEQSDPYWADHPNQYRRRFGKDAKLPGTSTMKDGGDVRRDGRAVRGKTKGRFI